MGIHSIAVQDTPQLLIVFSFVIWPGMFSRTRLGTCYTGWAEGGSAFGIYVVFDLCFWGAWSVVRLVRL